MTYYDDDIRPTRQDTISGYVLPVIALLSIFGFGMWYASTPISSPTTPTTMERTTATR